MTTQRLIAGACLMLAGLCGYGCSGQRDTASPGSATGYSNTGSDAQEAMAEQSPDENVNAGDAETWADAADGDGDVARVVAGRWEARFEGRTMLIELETSNGSLSGTVREGDNEPVPIEIGVVTNDGFVFETGGGGRWLWTAKFSSGLLSGRREKVDTGRVESFDAHRVAD